MPVQIVDDHAIVRLGMRIVHRDARVGRGYRQRDALRAVGGYSGDGGLATLEAYAQAQPGQTGYDPRE